MDEGIRKGLSIASLAFGVLLYLLSVAGVFTAGFVPPLDPGLVATCGIFILLGAAGIWQVKVTPTA